MTLNQIICRAASVYPDGFILEYWDMQESQPRDNVTGGDTLAEFVARELNDTFDPEADEATQIATAVRAMQTAADDLQAVAHSLSDLAVRRAA